MIKSHFFRARCLALNALLLKAFAVFDATAVDYFISPTGNDSHSGNSLSQAWQTIARVNSQDFNPGDRILFEANATFFGRIYLDGRDQGTRAEPVIISSYGNGRATIDGQSSNGLFAYNTAGITIQNLEFRGAGVNVNTGAGILFYTELSDGSKLDSVVIDNVEVSGFLTGGIILASWNASQPGYQHVQIVNSYVHDNGRVGIQTFGLIPDGLSQPVYAHEDVYIGSNIVTDNYGDPGFSDKNTGSGIVLSHVDGSLIEYNLASNNGGIQSSSNSAGPVGIWTYYSNAAIIQHNISRYNRTGGENDGGGFDLDGGTTNSILQYNYSYGNEGPGLLMAQYAGAKPHNNNIIRYNISYDDAQNEYCGAITLWAAAGETIEDAFIYDNTVVLTKNQKAARYGFYLIDDSSQFLNITFQNNIINTYGGVPVLRSLQPTSGRQIYFRNNCYWSNGDQFSIIEGSQSYSSLQSWRQATGQEYYSGAPIGLSADPEFVNDRSPQLIVNPSELEQLTAFELMNTSPLIDTALNPSILEISDQASVDFLGNALPQGSADDFGAIEYMSDEVQSQPPANNDPYFLTTPIVADPAEAGQDYFGTLSDQAEDPDGDSLVFLKISGPDWLNIFSDGSLEGTPSMNDVGVNEFTVAVSDGNGGTREALMYVEVQAASQAIGIPEPPSDLQAMAFRKRKIILTWKDNSENEDGFQIERSMDSLNWEVVGYADADTTEVVDSRLRRGSTYYYRVLAYNEAGGSAYSNITSATAK